MILAYPVRQHIVIAFNEVVNQALITIKDSKNQIIDQVEVTNTDYTKIYTESSLKKLRIEISINGKTSIKKININ